MENRYGFPIVTADNLSTVLAALGIRVWAPVQPPMSLDNYQVGDLTPRQREEIRRFAPRSEVVFLQDPKGNPFTGFRSVGKNWVTTFALLEGDLVPITIEYKHGADVVVLVPPSGVPGRRETGLEDPMSACARREFLEETGVELAEVTLLSGPEGIPVSSRQSTLRYFPFLGIPKMPISLQERRLDSTEFLRVVLIPLKEWLKLIGRGGVEDSAISTTFLALQRLGRLKIE